ncbi:substrate-binding domain-containing protein [Agrococcus beijingensis]|uniref:substrate-binding domain-containing protein n=1 Tax=Agrococcus beijingensis TaxID=3068634 RepID=UPI00274263FA|nr:substrate-binding domain-containing protein [Agrococcus sp. REN33]
MRTTTIRARRARALAAVGAAAVLALSACSTAEPAETTEPTAAESEAPETEAPGNDLDAALAALLEPRDAYPVPDSPTGDVASLAGSTVYYVPLTQQAPQFSVTGVAVTEAFAAVDIDVQICNGNATPTDVSACITQATQADASAIITDAVPYGMAANALDAAQAAGIPVVQNNNAETPDHPASDTLLYAPDGSAEQIIAHMQWIASDSDGAGTVLVNKAADGASVPVTTAALAEAEAECPDCTVVVNDVTSANFGLIAPSTSSALLREPNVEYVLTQYAIHLQPTQGGVEQAGRAADTKGVVGASQLGALQQLASENFLYAATGQASVFQGWVVADLAMRAVLGSDIPEYEIPVRLFTRETIGEVNLTAEGEASGEWFGPATFREDFLANWGAE